MQITAAALLVAALAHTFCAPGIHKLAQRHARHSGLLHLLGEVELVFGLWALVLIVAMAAVDGPSAAIGYATSRQYTEPLFVCVIVVIAASMPVLHAVQSVLALLARCLPLPAPLARSWLGLAAVPLAGSLITEPAAMTLAALLLGPLVFRADIPDRLKYVALGVLFVNVSIGGTLTAYAAPPVLMVANTWHWDSAFMFSQFGWKAALAVLLNASAVVFLLRKQIASDGGAATQAMASIESQQLPRSVPLAVTLAHLSILAATVAMAHQPLVLVGIFLAFLGLVQWTKVHQARLHLKEGLLVGLFLAGLVVLGGMQQWWLQALLADQPPLPLFFGAAGLTAITDNAALTYLGAQIEGLSLQARMMLVAGAVAGGGLTVIANAPNPAGVALLRHGFRGASVSATGLLLGALPPTLVAMAAMLLP